LLKGGSLPSDWASELEKSIKEASALAPPNQLETMKDVALAKELARMLEAVPEIETARVLWTPSKKRPFPRGATRVTATVYLKPRHNRELSMQLVQSARAAVAGAVPELSPSDVVVFDTSTGKSYTPEKDTDPYQSRQLQRVEELTQAYRKKVADALDYIEDVLITVNVTVDNLKSHVERAQTIDPKKSVSLQQTDQTRTSESSQQLPRAEPGNQANRPQSLQAAGSAQQSQKEQESNTSSVVAPSFIVSEKEFAAAMPKEVQVAVQIPETYFQKVLAQSAGSAGAPAGAPGSGAGKSKDEIIADVKAAVAKAVGAPTADAISVSSYVQVPSVEPDVKTPWTGTLSSAASRWGGAVGLGLFALWALRMLQKTTPKLPETQTVSATPTPAAPVSVEAADDDDEEPKPKIVSKRDRLQTAVRDNPEVAATVLSKWIQSSK
jgi:flagellar M-ring protein FliF